MYPITNPEMVQVHKARPIGTFVVTRWPNDELTKTTYWVEKVTQHTEHGAEVLSRWCEAPSDRKAYLIATALNNVPYIKDDDQRGETLMTEGER